MKYTQIDRQTDPDMCTFWNEMDETAESDFF